MESSNAEPPADFYFIARPNCSLSPASRILFLCFVSSLTFGIALAFACLGAWLILPFAGLEVGVLVWAFQYVGCHAGDYEKIAIRGDRMMVECRNAAQLSRHEFNRYWAQVVLDAAAPGRCRLALRSHGQELELGRHMNCEQRQALARELRLLLSD